MAHSRNWDGIYKMRMGYLVKPEGKEVLKKQKDGSVAKGQKSQLKELSIMKAGTVYRTK